MPSLAGCGMLKKRQTTSVSAPMVSTTCRVAESGRKFTKVPSPSSPPSRSMRPRSAAITIGGGGRGPGGGGGGGRRGGGEAAGARVPRQGRPARLDGLPDAAERLDEGDAVP